MQNETTDINVRTRAATTWHYRFWLNLKKYKFFYMMLLPGVAYFIIFRYGPMWGLFMAFIEYNPFLGALGSKFVGFKHFERFFVSSQFSQLLYNTLILALYNLVFFFPIPIILALMLNEVKVSWYKRLVQSLIYIPHFISWVVVIGICYIMFNSHNGTFTDLYREWTGNELNILLNPRALRPMLVIQSIWKEAGWGTIIFLAALSAVDVEQYEAAYIDGASNFKRLIYITLPALRSTIVIMFILRLGRFLDTGFDQIYNMLNPMNRDVGEVFDTYIYQQGLLGAQFSYTTAVGMFKSVVSLALVFTTDFLAKKIGEEGIF